MLFFTVKHFKISVTRDFWMCKTFQKPQKERKITSNQDILCDLVINYILQFSHEDFMI